MKFLVFVLFLFPLSLMACSGHGKGEVHVISSFEDCVEHGNRILRTNPPRCVDREKGKIFVQGEASPQGEFGEGSSEDSDMLVCIDKCGDGTCHEIVCLGTGCPCAETPESCPKDCGAA